MDEEKKSKIKNILEWGYCVLIAIVLALIVRYYVGTPTVVQMSSMYDTLEEGQRLILNRWIRTVGGEYKRGDIITLEAPSKSSFSPYEVDESNPIAVYEYTPSTLFGKFSYYVLEFGKKSYIKRIIGLPGEHIKIEDGNVYINGELLDEPYLDEGVITDGGTFRDITVPEGYVFVMGDNREHSTDSREIGCIPIEKIESKVLIRFWPLDKFGKVE